MLTTRFWIRLRRGRTASASHNTFARDSPPVAQSDDHSWPSKSWTTDSSRPRVSLPEDARVDVARRQTMPACMSRTSVCLCPCLSSLAGWRVLRPVMDQPLSAPLSAFHSSLEVACCDWSSQRLRMRAPRSSWEHGVRVLTKFWPQPESVILEGQIWQMPAKRRTSEGYPRPCARPQNQTPVPTAPGPTPRPSPLRVIYPPRHFRPLCPVE